MRATYLSVVLGFVVPEGAKWNPTTCKLGVIYTLARCTNSAAESYSAGRLETKVGITNEEVQEDIFQPP